MTTTASISKAPDEPALVRPERDRRIDEVDALRGLAAVAVMLFHYTGQGRGLHDEGLLFHVPWGNYGVQLFFVISGYVILMTVRKVKSATEFAVLRFARLYPTFWLACGLTYLSIQLFRGPSKLYAWEVAANLLMMQVRHMRPIEGVYWTLHQEMYFYLVMLGLLALGTVCKAMGWALVPIRYAQTVMAAFVVASLCGLRFTEYFSLFLIGMALFDSMGGFKRRHAVFLALAAADVVNRSLTGEQPDMHGWGYVAAVAVCGLLVLIATRVRMPWLANPVLLYLGKISYPLYLVHATMGYIVIRWLKDAGASSNMAVLGAIAVMLGLASAMTFGVERPAGRAIRGWWKRREAKRALTEE
jgi:peptidoglycan/LPS O-acetylase OafA/YrhL